MSINGCLVWCFAGVVIVAGPLPSAAQASNSDVLIDGQSLDSPQLRSSLASPFWRALASAPCPQLSWSPDVSSDAAFARSVQPIRKRIIEATGPLLPGGSALLQSATLYSNAKYAIERIIVRSRIPNSRALGYLVRPRGAVRPAPIIVLIHGTGMDPREAFGWNAIDSYHQGERAAHASFVASAIEFAEAGYAVYVPWLADNSQTTTWRQFPWPTLERNGAALRSRVRNLGPPSLLMNEIAGGLDFASSIAGVDTNRIAIAGWREGSYLAALIASLDPRIKAVVRMSAPIDRKALRASEQGVFADAHFSHSDCALTDVDLAAALAPRPLLYTYATNDESINASLISPEITTQIRAIYTGVHRSNNFSIRAGPSWDAADRRHLTEWVDAALGFSPRSVADSVRIREPSSSALPPAWIDSLRSDRQSYSVGLGTCVPRSVTPDFASLSSFSRSVEPFRQSVRQELGIPASLSAGVRVVRRTLIGRRTGYTLEFVQIRSDRVAMLISGLLALPTNTGARVPAVVSADGDAGLALPFRLSGRETIPYLNGYADAVASSGTVVFVPFYPFEFPEIAAAELAARTGGAASSFSITIPMLSASADFVLSLPEVDSDHLAVWGISFAGVAALYAGAMDTRFSAVVFSDPVVSADVLFETQTSSSLAAWWPEICSTIDAVQAYLIAPRRFIRENGLRDANGMERVPLESVNRIRDVYRSLGVSSEFVLVRHTGGHETRPREVSPFLR